MSTEKEPHRAGAPPHAATSPAPAEKERDRARKEDKDLREGRGRGRGTPETEEDEDAVKLPTLRELDEEQGDEPGSIRLDVDLATGEAKRVKVDAKGKESK